MTNLKKFCSLIFLLLSTGTMANTQITFTQHALKYENNTFILQEVVAKTAPNNAANVLLVHGLTYSSHQFDINYKDYSLAQFLARNGFRVWLIDITGYGLSSKPENGFTVDTDYAVNDLALATNYIRKTTNSKKIDVLGWSWGTITTARLASTHPDWINKLILYAPIYRGLNLPEPTEDYQAFTIQAAQDDMRKIPGNPSKIDYSLIEQGVVDIYTQQCIHYDSAGSPNGSRRDLFQSNEILFFDPEKLTMPTLIIAGTADPYLNFNDITEIVTLLPNQATYYEVKNGSHILMLEKDHYRNFQAAVLDFLK
jgi:pimeloyl-ACP methyl ester carboxylesterase